jgi:4-amino-4-deoxy-L-arabinose transferase-like glycosyltransferase
VVTSTPEPKAQVPRIASLIDLPWLALILAIGLFRLAPGLAHPEIASWDESAHQAVTRGIRDTGLPVIYKDPLIPIRPDDWLGAGVFLHKPILPFWLGAQVMRLTGVTPLALRIVSLCASLLAACVLFLLARRSTGRLLASLLAIAYLTLPFHWRLVQGYQFGDVTDTTLAAFVTLAFWLLLLALERESARFAVAAGVAVGLGFLSKNVLALAPLGAAAVAIVLPLNGSTARFRLRAFLWMLLAATVVAAPWSVYTALRWPALFWQETAHTVGHLNGSTVTNWQKPFDAIWNEINEVELTPFPPAVALLAGLFLLARGLRRRREPEAVLLALWLLIEWTVLSLARAKVPAIVWAAAPPLLIGFGQWILAARFRPTLAGALLGAILAPALTAARLPFVEHMRAGLPSFLVQTRSRPGLFEGLLLALAAGVLGWLLARPKATRQFVVPALAIAAMIAALNLALLENDRALRAQVAALRDQSLESYTDQLGLALDRLIPEKSVLLLATDRNRPCCFEKQNLMFWSGRMAYPRAFEQRARDHGYHPYLISSSAQPYALVPGVPAGSPLQAFDLDVALPGPSPMPEGVSTTDIDAKGTEMIGLARLRGDATRDRYAFYLHSPMPQSRTDVSFFAKGGAQEWSLGPELSLQTAGQLRDVPWYILPALGPRRSVLTGISFGGIEVPGSGQKQLPPAANAR